MRERGVLSLQEKLVHFQLHCLLRYEGLKSLLSDRFPSPLPLTTDRATKGPQAQAGTANEGLYQDGKQLRSIGMYRVILYICVPKAFGVQAFTLDIYSC
jgi:hypothetical protein